MLQKFVNKEGISKVTFSLLFYLLYKSMKKMTILITFGTQYPKET